VNPAPRRRSKLTVTGVLVLVLVVLAPATALAANATPRVSGGTLTGPAAAPFVVTLLTDTNEACTGVIVGPQTVWTAAHCVSTPSGEQSAPGSITVRAGTADRDGSDGQKVAVVAIRRHPGFAQNVDKVQPDDVAVLTLATALTFNSTVSAITPVAAPGAGAPLTLYGYGAQGPGADQNDGMLRRAAMTVTPQASCGPFNAIELCYAAPTASTCPGDSGGPVTTPQGNGEVLVAINNGGFCQAGTSAVGAKVGAPELAAFLAGSDTPPTAPRPGSTAYDPFYAIVGQSLKCHAVAFTGTAPLTSSAVFVDQASAAVVQQDGTVSHVLTGADVGHQIGCSVAVTNAGGTFQGGLLQTDGTVVPLAISGLGLRISGASYVLFGRTDAKTVTLITTDQRGRTRDARTLAWPSRRTTRTPFRSAGRYETCVASAQTVFVAAGRGCVTTTVSGRTRSLVHPRRATSRRGRVTFSFSVDRRLVGRRVRVVQRVDESGRRFRRLVRRVRLRAVTRFDSVSVPRGGRLRAAVELPSVSFDGVPYRGGTLVFRRSQRR
jgi:V8-like Glu-specific endopeptidase